MAFQETLVRLVEVPLVGQHPISEDQGKQ